MGFWERDLGRDGQDGGRLCPGIKCIYGAAG